MVTISYYDSSSVCFVVSFSIFDFKTTPRQLWDKIKLTSRCHVKVNFMHLISISFKSLWSKSLFRQTARLTDLHTLFSQLYFAYTHYSFGIVTSMNIIQFYNYCRHDLFEETFLKRLFWRDLPKSSICSGSNINKYEMRNLWTNSTVYVMSNKDSSC